MHEKTTIETEIGRLQFGLWNSETETFTSLDNCNENEVMEALGINANMFDALNMFAGEISDLVASDLRSIWERIDRLEARIKGEI